MPIHSTGQYPVDGLTRQYSGPGQYRWTVELILNSGQFRADSVTVAFTPGWFNITSHHHASRCVSHHHVTSSRITMCVTSSRHIITHHDVCHIITCVTSLCVTSSHITMLALCVSASQCLCLSFLCIVCGMHHATCVHCLPGVVCWQCHVADNVFAAAADQHCVAQAVC